MIIKKTDTPRRALDPNFDPTKFVQHAIDNKEDQSIFEEIDERSVPKAPNIVEWLLGKTFCAVPRLFAKQIEILTNTLAQFCPACSEERYLIRKPDRTYISMPTEMPHTEVQSRIVFFHHGICPKCGVGRNEFLQKKLLINHNNLVGCAGMRSSKSVMVAFLGTYQLHRYLTVPNPAKYFELLPTQVLRMMFVALTAEQAQEGFWDPFSATFLDAPWTKNYHRFLEGYEKKLKKKLFVWKKTFYYYGHKRLHGAYKGADIGTLPGRTRFFTGLDEAAMMDEAADNNKIKKNADGTRTLLVKSLANVRARAHKLRMQGDNDPLEGYDCAVSSPRSVRDPIMRWLREAEDDPKTYSFHLSTFQVNPDISVESLEDERRKDPLEYDRQYLAIPPLGRDPFISNEGAVDKLHSTEPQSLVRWDQKVAIDPVAGFETCYLEALCNENRQYPRLLAVDTGYQFNSFALSVFHYSRALDKVVVDAILELEPTETCAVNFSFMFDRCIVPIVKNLNIKAALYDRWQHLDHMSRLRHEHKVDAQAITLRKDHFDLFKAKVFSTSILLPKREIEMSKIRSSKIHPDQLLRNQPVSNASLQMLTVRKVGQTVTKPAGGNDDVFRTLVLGVTYLFDPENTARFAHEGDAPSRKGVGNRPLAVYLSGRGSVRENTVKRSDGKAAVFRTKRLLKGY